MKQFKLCTAISRYWLWMWGQQDKLSPRILCAHSSLLAVAVNNKWIFHACWYVFHHHHHSVIILYKNEQYAFFVICKYPHWFGQTGETDCCENNKNEWKTHWESDEPVMLWLKNGIGEQTKKTSQLTLWTGDIFDELHSIYSLHNDTDTHTNTTTLTTKKHHRTLSVFRSDFHWFFIVFTSFSFPGLDLAHSQKSISCWHDHRCHRCRLTIIRIYYQNFSNSFYIFPAAHNSPID